MSSAKYDNSSYWVGIHEEFAGSLRAVGWPELSEEFNKLKYLSETHSFLEALDAAVGNKRACSILEVGVGIGYWTALQLEYGRNKSVDVDVTALDISDSALLHVKERFPAVHTMQVDLKAIDVDRCRAQFDVVSAIMVLLHLTDIEAYIRALRFCARSVKEGGSLLLFEPLIRRSYSPWSSMEYEKFSGNSVARSMSTVDNVLVNEGFQRHRVFPGPSWMLTSPIQASSRVDFALKQTTWRALSRLVYRGDAVTRRCARPLMAIDRALKRKNPDSASFVLYKRERR